MTIKFFDVQADAPRSAVFVIYGLDKTGKTCFAGTFPNPVFIVPEAERGTSSLKMLNKKIHWTPVQTRAEMEEACWAVRNDCKKYDWKTVVIDPFTTYGRIVLQEVEESEGSDDTRKIYNIVGNHLINVWKILQGAPLHVVWILHQSEVKSGDQILSVEPDLVGKIAIKHIKQNADLICYMAARTVPVYDEEGKPTGRHTVDRRVFTQCPPGTHPRFLAGGRWEELLPEGATGYYPHWDRFEQRLKGVIAT